MNAKSQIPEQQLLAFCKASAEAIRLDILRILQRDSFGVMELCQIFDLPQPGLSHHLKILATAGMLETRREGNSIFYRRALIPTDHPLRDMQQCLFNTIDQLNFSHVDANTSLGWLGIDGINGLKVTDESAHNELHTFFYEKDGFLMTRQDITIFMATTDPFIAENDCLLYLTPDVSHH